MRDVLDGGGWKRWRGISVFVVWESSGKALMISLKRSHIGNNRTLALAVVFRQEGCVTLLGLHIVILDESTFFPSSDRLCNPYIVPG